MGKAAVDGEPALSSNDTIKEHEVNDTVKNAGNETDSIKSETIPSQKTE